MRTKDQLKEKLVYFESIIDRTKHNKDDGGRQLHIAVCMQRDALKWVLGEVPDLIVEYIVQGIEEIQIQLNTGKIQEKH